MDRVSFKMKLFPGYEMEYRKRHDEIWDGLKRLLIQKGISNYSIFLDKETYILFAYLEISDKKRLDELPQVSIMQDWWEYMKDIMETNDDGSPKSLALEEVFHLIT